MVHPTDSSLRNFSASCLKEFLLWSIKQTTKKVSPTISLSISLSVSLSPSHPPPPPDTTLPPCPQMQEKSPINTKSLLKRLYSLALHPSAAKRLGAALAINSIYTVFRWVEPMTCSELPE